MNNQIFLACYHDPNHERITFYSSAPLDFTALREIVDAYQIAEAQFLNNPIFLLYDEIGKWGTLGTPTWNTSMRLISPEDMRILDLDHTDMFCVNRTFLSMLATDDEGKDIIDMVGGISYDVVREIFEKSTCFICIVSRPPMIDPEIPGMPDIPDMSIE